MKLELVSPGLRGALIAAAILAGALAGCAEVAPAVDGGPGRQPLPTGQYATPLAVPRAHQQPLNPGLAAYPDFVAGEAVRAQLSPDGTTLAVLCAGQNSLFDRDGKVDAAHSTQYIFLYDVAGANRSHPLLRQVLKQTNAYVGLAFAPDGQRLYAAGGSDDAVHVYALSGGSSSGGTWAAAGRIALGHGGKGVGVDVEPNAGGLAISDDGATLVVANNYNDSISVVDTASARVRYEHDLRPYFAANEGTPGVAGGEYPFAVAMAGNGRVYVSSARDREVVVVDVSAKDAGKLVARIPLAGNALGLTLNRERSRLYVAQDNVDEVAVIDTADNRVVERIDARAPAGMLPARYAGASTYGVTLSPDGETLYAVNAGANSIAVIPLAGNAPHGVAGLIPTAYEPHDIRFSADGRWMYIVNGKSDTGPNPAHLTGATAKLAPGTYPGGNAAAARAAKASNQYQFQLEHATLVAAPVPDAATLAALTARVAANNGYAVPLNAADARVMDFLRGRIRHVIYIVKENRTFDQILGDLGNGSNGDPTLAVFGRRITPNFHALASEFVTLDNFLDPGDGSMDGWSWATQGRVTQTQTLTQQIAYGAVNRGLSYESEGENRNVAVGLASTAARDAASGGRFSAAAAELAGGSANLLPGAANHESADAPFGIQRGAIFDAVAAAGGTVRNYGFLVRNIGAIGTAAAPISDPHGAGVVQVAALNPALLAATDLYFRGFDQNYPDLWRYDEWKREFDRYVADGNLPSLSLVRFSHDHTGSFATALAGVTTPETQQADDDLAVGRLVEAVAHSPYAADTLIIVTEDDCQDGPDHYDS
ncbi:MAG: beta-propeller fold lactonase family protein, partial [Burkholderiales bacterium]|nr:beta-propeller fold lactonase family protein [Burkholderiales bacterium]